MKPRISVITLGVDDLQRSVAFYRDGLGLNTAGIVGTEFEHGAVAFFDLQQGLRLAVWPRASLAHDSGLDVGPSSPSDFSLGHNVSTRTEVDEVIAQATAAGATVVKAAHDTFWVVTQVIFKTWMGTFGKWCTTPICCPMRPDNSFKRNPRPGFVQVSRFGCILGHLPVRCGPA